MRAETLAGGLGIAGLLLSATIALRPAPLPPAPGASLQVPFPPAPRERMPQSGSASSLPGVLALEGEIARLGRAAPRLDALRRAFQDAPSLAQFALERLPRAAAGDGASAYFIYLALDQCRSYLRSDFDGAAANLERLTNVSGLNPEEQVAWRSDLERCRGFALSDWSALGAALGEDQPGAVVEYAGVWFERAAQWGYAPALAEQALRPSPYDAEARAAMLDEALPARSAEVYWLLFAHSGEVAAGEVTVPALAWLIVACRAGQDCTEDARWYRNFACTLGERRCEAGQSALEYYWFLASPYERDRAWTTASRIDSALKAGHWAELPLPDLERLNSARLWGGE